MTQKEIDYASKINMQLKAMFEDNAENYIDKADFQRHESYLDFVRGLERACRSICDTVKECVED